MFRPLPLLLVACLTACTPAQGQQRESSVPPLDLVVEHLGTHSPRLRAQHALVAKNQAQVQRARSSWADNITAGVTTTYGSYGSAVLDELNLGAQAGFTIRMSLFDLIGRRHDVNVFRQELRIAEEQLDVVRQDEEAAVIALWHRLSRSEELVATRSMALESARTHQAMAERQFAQGDITIAEMARVTEITSKAEAEFVDVRYDFRDAWARLESVLGIPLTSLNRNS